MLKRFLSTVRRFKTLHKKYPDLYKIMGGYFPLAVIVNLTDDRIDAVLTEDDFSLKVGESFTEAYFARKSFLRCNFDLDELMDKDTLLLEFSKKMDPIGFEFEIFITRLRKFRMSIIPFYNNEKKVCAMFIVKTNDKEKSFEEISETNITDFKRLDRNAILESNYITAGELDLTTWKVNFVIKPIPHLKDNADLSTVVFEFAKHFGERSEFQKINEFFSYANIHKKIQKQDEISEVFIRRKENSPQKYYSRWTISKSQIDKNILIVTEVDITSEIEAEHHRVLANNYHQALLSDALIVFNTNVTKDIIEEEVFYASDGNHKSLMNVINLTAPVTYTSFLEKTEKYISSEYVEDLHKAINIRALRKSFRFGSQEITNEYEITIDNKKRWVNHTILMTKNPENDEITAVTIIKDTTQAHVREETHRQKLNEALFQAEAANKAKTDFLSNLSHDIRTPMNAIYGLTSVAKEYTGDKSKMDDYIEKVTVASNHLLTLVNNVLDISRIESGKIQINQEEFKLNNLFNSIQTIIGPQTRNKNIQFNVNINTTTRSVLGDELRLNLILINILGNAVKFTPENGTIDFQVSEVLTDNITKLTFSVSDTGIGMSKEFISKIFMPFTRDEKQAMKIEGSGLGMNITKNLVDLMGGEITVESELGKGSTFVVVIPFTTVEEKDNKINYMADGIPDFSNRRILLAEDNELNMEVASRFLEKTGCLFDKAVNGQIALDMFIKNGENWYDLILMDMEMPVLNGIDAVKNLRKIDSDYARTIPVIAMTGNIYEEDKQRAMKAGMTNYITKPISRDRLYEKMIIYFVDAPKNPTVEHKRDDLDTQVKTEETSTESTAKAQSSTPVYNFEGKKILIVDDNKMNLEIVKLMLAKTKASFIEATNGLEALETFNDSEIDEIDIILMDISMPVMNGYEAAKKIRTSNRKDRNVPIIAISANAFPEDIERSEENGINYHISKPIVMKTLLEKINEYL